MWNRQVKILPQFLNLFLDYPSGERTSIPLFLPFMLPSRTGRIAGEIRVAFTAEDP